jgi:hypothetical protein
MLFDGVRERYALEFLEARPLESGAVRLTYSSDLLTGGGLDAWRSWYNFARPQPNNGLGGDRMISRVALLIAAFLLGACAEDDVPGAAVPAAGGGR